MKNMIGAKALLLVVSAILLAASPTSFGQSSSSVEQAVIKLEQERVAAVLKGDLAALERILADDFTYTHSNARVETKRQFLDALKAGAFAYEAITHSEVQAKAYGDTVLLRGKSDLKIKANNLPLAFQTRFLGVYVKLNGRWQLTAWHSTRVPQ